MESTDREFDQSTFVNSAELIDGLLRVSQLVRAQFNTWLDQFELNDGRFTILSTLSQMNDGGCSQVDLAERLGQSESNISTLIERMARDGLVSRSRSIADRRKRVLSITNVGRSQLALADRDRAVWAGRLLRGYSSENRQKLSQTLRELLQVLESPITFEANSLVSKESLSISDHHRSETSDDGHSPYLALREMLSALSTSVCEIPSGKRDAA